MTAQKKPILKFGVIDETEFSLRSPRVIDGDECDTFAEALVAAGALLEDGIERVSVVRCRYNEKTECWHEIPGGGSITIDADNIDHWFEEGGDDEEAEAREAGK